MEKEMKNRKGRREGSLPANCSAQPARSATSPGLLGFSARQRTAASQPLGLRGPACGPASPVRPSALLTVAAALAPCVSRALLTRALTSFAHSRYQWTPPVSVTVHLPHAALKTAALQSPDNGGRAGQGSCPRHGPVSPSAPRPRNPSWP